MKHGNGLRRLTAWTLAALLLCAPCCAETALPEDVAEALAAPVDAEVAELGDFELTGQAPWDGEDTVLDLDGGTPGAEEAPIAAVEATEATEPEEAEAEDAADAVDVAEAEEPAAADAVDAEEPADVEEPADAGEAEAPEAPEDGALLAAGEAEEAPLALGATSLKLGLKEKYTLTAALSPAAAELLAEGGATPAVRFTSSKKSVVAVNAATGQLTAKKRGKAVITVTAGPYAAKCAVQVLKAPSKVRFAAKSVTLGEGEGAALRAKLPAKTASQLRFASSDPAVASVDAAGRVTGVGLGTATITVKTFNGKKATCKVRVAAAPLSVTLSPAALTLGVGESARASAAVNAGSAGAVTFSSGDAGVVSVSGSTVTGAAVGEAQVLGTAYNGVSGAMAVAVVPAPTSVSLGTGTITLGRGEKLALQPAIDEGSHASFSYKSKNKRIATVSAAGVVKGVRRGKTTVTVTTHNGKRATVTVKVVNAPRKVTLSPSKLALALGASRKLAAKLPSRTGSRLSFASSNPAVASVDAGGTVTARGVGTATITVKTFNGKKAKCAVTVTEAQTPPGAPGDLRVAAESATTAVATWTGDPRAKGYRVYVGAEPASAELYGEYAGATARAALRGLAAGETRYVRVVAWNGLGEAASDWVPVTLPAGETGEEEVALALNPSGALMLRPGSSRQLIATLGPGADGSELRWETTSDAVAAITAGGSRCTVTAQGVGVATVSAELPGGASASVTITVANPSDTSAQNLARVQAAVARHENLLEEDAGDGVIWDVIAASMTASGVLESRVQETVSRVRQAAAEFRDLFVYAFGSFDIVGEATVNSKGNAISTSYYFPTDNTLYLKPSSLGNASYAYVLLHESGHAIDYNAGDNRALNSLNDDAYAAIVADVRAVLGDRLAAAAAGAGVDIAAIDGDRVVDAVLDYRELLQHDEVMSALSAEEQAVYQQLVDGLTAEMNATLPKNNGTMVWDAVEGATNFAVSGSYGHSYMFTIDAYKELAMYYFYDRDGKPSISSEPWAEFFAAGLMGDEETIAVNRSFLPETCRYFAETLLPAALDWFKGKVLG